MLECRAQPLLEAYDRSKFWLFCCVAGLGRSGWYVIILLLVRGWLGYCGGDALVLRRMPRILSVLEL